MKSWKIQSYSYREQVGITWGWGRGMGLTVQGGNVLYLDYSGGYMKVYICQVLDLYA